MTNFCTNLQRVLRLLIFIFKILKNQPEHDDPDIETLPRTQLNMSMIKERVSKASKFQKKLSKSKSSKVSDIVNRHFDFADVTELVSDRFYLATLLPGKIEPSTIGPNVHLFETDSRLQYNNYYNDFGPLNIACLYKYCQEVNYLLSSSSCSTDTNNTDGRIRQPIVFVHYTSSRPEPRANAFYLVASYSLIYLRKTPREIYDAMFADLEMPIRPFRDATIDPSRYHIDILDCLKALKKSLTLGFFDFDDFDVREYERYEKFKNGDLNWIVPSKFLAFIGPSVPETATNGTDFASLLHCPEKYVNYFKKNNVTAVIRLNKKSYEALRFTSAGMLHYDMFFPDGTSPPKAILKQFLHTAETIRGALAVHCKAGLGRTGTLIAAYLMKHYGFTAREAIAWLRICRPGSVIGPQQSWLESIEAEMWREGRRFRLERHGDENMIFRHVRGIYSLAGKVRNDDDDVARCRRNNRRRRRHRQFTDEEEWRLAICGNTEQLIPERVKGTDKKYNFFGTTQGDKLNGIKIKRSKIEDDDEGTSRGWFES